MAVPSETMPRCKLAIGLFLLSLSACDPAVEPAAVGGPLAMRRLTSTQYKRAVADIKVTGRFEPDARRDGLISVGGS